MTQPILSTHDPGISLHDFIVLRDVFCREVLSLLAMPATVSFWSEHGSLAIIKKSPLSSDEDRIFSELCRAGDPGVVQKMLVIPLHVQGTLTAGVVVRDIAVGLLEKMSKSWLIELREQVYQRLCRVKRMHIDLVSGRYDNRCFLQYLSDCITAGNSGFLLFVSPVPRNRGIVAGLRALSPLASFMEEITSSPVFHVGHGVFALVFENIPRNQVMEFARRLLRRFKRERLAKAHIGVTSLSESRDGNAGESVLEDCWRALEEAERRGPFGLGCGPGACRCEAKRLVRPAMPVLARLRAAWRGVERFGLVLLRVDEVAGKQPDIRQLVLPFLAEKQLYVPVSDKEGYVLLPFFSEAETRSWVERVHSRMKKDCGKGFQSISQGGCSWPFLRYTKTVMTVNCRKALMHGELLGSAQVVFFNNISLNVSGDYYFDEGDYRRAAKEYRTGLDLQPDDINLMNSLGVALTEVNRRGLAVKWFKEVLSREPGDFMALANLGFAIRGIGRGEEALHYLERAHESAPESRDLPSEFFLQLGGLYCRLGRYRDAVKILEKWESEKFARKEFHLYRLLGEGYMRLGESDKAIRALQRALHYYPGSAETLSMLGLLYAETGQGDEIGLSLCRKAVALDEDDAANWQRLGCLLLHRENISEAQDCAKKSLQLKKKDNTGARLLLGRIYEQMKQYKRAGKQYEKVLRAGDHAALDKEEAGCRLVALTGEKSWECKWTQGCDSV